MRHVEEPEQPSACEEDVVYLRMAVVWMFIFWAITVGILILVK